jgi:ATP-dependent Clp protease adaptor protein ClpS
MKYPGEVVGYHHLSFLLNIKVKSMSGNSEAETVTKIKTKVPSLWTVVMHNDDYTPMDFVVHVLIEVFGKSMEEATQIMMDIHEKDCAAVITTTKEIADMKVAMTNELAVQFEHPLATTAEPA